MSNADYPHGAIVTFGFKVTPQGSYTPRSSWIHDRYVPEFDGTEACLIQQLENGDIPIGWLAGYPQPRTIEIRDLEIQKVLDVRRAVKFKSVHTVYTAGGSLQSYRSLRVNKSPVNMLACTGPSSGIRLYEIRNRQHLSAGAPVTLRLADYSATTPADVYDKASSAFESAVYASRAYADMSGWLSAARRSRAELIEVAKNAADKANIEFWQGVRALVDRGETDKTDYRIL